MQTVGGRLKEEAKRLHGWSLQTFAEKVGVSYETARKWVTGETAPNRKRAEKCAELLNRTPEWVMFGVDAEADDELSAGAALSEHQITEYENVEDLPLHQYVLVPSVAVKLSAGDGKAAYHVEAGPAVPFVADFIRGLNARPAGLRAVKVDGDSMESLLFDGDLLLVDTADTRVRDGGVYALRIEGDLKVKRLFPLPGGGLVVSSDNKAKHRELQLGPEQAAEVEVIGRVKYRSGTGDF